MRAVNASTGTFRNQPRGNRGLSKTPLYRLWISMKARCLTPTNGSYRWYGGRGINPPIAGRQRSCQLKFRLLGAPRPVARGACQLPSDTSSRLRAPIRVLGAGVVDSRRPLPAAEGLKDLYPQPLFM
jgi:hypothetical protein